MVSAGTLTEVSKRAVNHERRRQLSIKSDLLSQLAPSSIASRTTNSPSFWVTL
jgi:hypothetical protein